MQTIDELTSYINDYTISSVDELLENLPESFTKLGADESAKFASDAALVNHTGALCQDDVDPINNPRLLLLATEKEKLDAFGFGVPRTLSSLWLTLTTDVSANATCRNIIELIEVQSIDDNTKALKFAKGEFVANENGGFDFKMTASDLLTEVKEDSFNMFSEEENCGSCHTSTENKPVLVWDGGTPGISMFYWMKQDNWSRFYGRRSMEENILNEHEARRSEMLSSASQNPRIQSTISSLGVSLEQLAPAAVPMQSSSEQGAPEHFLHFDLAAFKASIPDMLNQD